MNSKKLLTVSAVFGASLLLTANAALAGGNCMLSYSQEHFAKVESSSHDKDPLVVSRQSEIDPKWLALLEKQQPETSTIVIHN